MKVCPKCKIEKDDLDFGVDKRSNTLRSWCRGCIKYNSKKNYHEKVKPALLLNKPKREVKDGYRWCLACEVEKKKLDFYKNGGNTCKVCANRRTLERQKINRAYITARQKEYRKKIGREVLNKAQQEWRSKNKKLCNLWARNTRSRLGDSYIKVNILKPKGLPATKQNIDRARYNILIKKIKKQIEKTGYKICSVCKQAQSISQFRNSSFWWKGVKKLSKKNTCKKCDDERTKKYKNKKS